MKAKLVEWNAVEFRVNFGWILGEFWVKWKQMKGNERKWKQNEL